MTTTLEVVNRATKLGLRLEPRGDQLAVTPASRCPPDFRDVLLEHKAKLLDLLDRTAHRVRPASKPRIPDEFLGRTRGIARAVFDKTAEIKTKARLEPLDCCWLFTGPPGLGKTTLAEAIGTLADNSFDVEQVNGQSCTIDVVRKWREQGWYHPMGSIRVQIVDEIDAASSAAVIELRTYLDKLPKTTVFIATTNKSVSQLPEPLQSRFKVYTFEPVAAEEVAQLLVSQYGVSLCRASRFAADATGNVRQAIATTLTWLESR